MCPRKAVRGALTLFVFFTLVLAACAQGAATYDEEATKSRIREYFDTFFPQLTDVTVENIQASQDSPFLEVTLSFVNRGRKQTQPVFMTSDGTHLILGQVWDLTRNPKTVQWEQKKDGAEQRLAQLDLSRSPSRGNPDAKVVVVEFSDYQCPYCSRAYATLENQMLEKYGDRVKFVFKHLPLEQIHPWAKKASIGAACAQQQSVDGFWSLHRLLFENQREIAVENLRQKIEQFATEAGLEVAPLLECFDSEATAPMVEADLRDANQMGITSTPTFLINGAMVSGAIPLEEMSGYIENALEDAKVAVER